MPCASCRHRGAVERPWRPDRRTARSLTSGQLPLWLNAAAALHGQRMHDDISLSRHWVGLTGGRRTPWPSGSAAGSNCGLARAPRRPPGTRSRSGTASAASSAPSPARSPPSACTWATSRPPQTRRCASGNWCLWWGRYIASGPRCDAMAARRCRTGAMESSALPEDCSKQGVQE